MTKINMTLTEFTTTKARKYHMYDDYVSFVSNIDNIIDGYFDIIASKIKDPDWEPPKLFNEEITLFKNLYRCEKKIVLTYPERNINEYFDLTIGETTYHSVPLFVKLDSDSSVFNEHEGIRFVLYRKVFCTENQYAKVKLAS